MKELGKKPIGRQSSLGCQSSLTISHVGSVGFEFNETPEALAALVSESQPSRTSRKSQNAGQNPVSPPKPAPRPPPPPLSAALPPQPLRRSVSSCHPDLEEVYKCAGHTKQFNVSTLVKDAFARVENPFSGYQICAYDLRQLVWFGGFIAGSARGSVFRDTPDLRIWILWHTFFFVVCTVVFTLVSENADGGIKLDGITSLSKTLNSMVPLLLGLYLELSLWRWWALRHDALGNLCDCITEVASLASVFISHQGVAQEVRFNVGRWGMASLYLIKEAARDGGQISKVVSEAAVQRSVLTAQEVAVLENIHPYVRAMVMWSWIARAVNENSVQSSGPEPFSNYVQVALNICVRARNALQVVHTYMSTALPFAYVHLVSLTVDVTTTVIGLKCSLVCANALGQDPPNVQAFVYELLHFFFVPIMYHGLLSVTYIIHDPFGEEIADFPMGFVMQNQAAVTSAARKGDERFPKSDLDKLNRLAGLSDVVTPSPANDESAENVEQESKAVTSSREVARQAAAHIMADATRETLKRVRGSLGGFAKELNLLAEEIAMADAARGQAFEQLTSLVESFTDLDNKHLAVELLQFA